MKGECKMTNPKFMTKLIAGALIGSAVLSTGGYALASTAKADAAKYANVQHVPHGKKRAHFADELKTKLDSLVKSGTITQDQKNKIIAYMEKKDQERKAEMDKIKNMTEAERKAYFEQNKDKHKTDIFADLVAQNIINQTQADAIKKLMPAGHPKDKCHGRKFSVDKMKSLLDNQVKAGTITQEEADKIVSFLNKKAEERKAEMEKVKNMTEAERKAYFEQKKDKQKADLFTDLVNQGILSQQKADALKKAMKDSFKKGEKHFKKDFNSSSTSTQKQNN
jgi:polyhydroxyalkanoate synthesis regulator phasin